MLQEVLKNETELNDIINNQKALIDHLLSEMRKPQQRISENVKELCTSSTQTNHSIKTVSQTTEQQIPLKHKISTKPMGHLL